MKILNYPVRQIAYVVPDVVEAAKLHTRLFGSGPYFLLEHVTVTNYSYKGTTPGFDTSSTVGQWGDVQMEFVTQHNADLTHISDLFPAGKSGIHHMAIIPDDLEAAVTAFEAEGMTIIARLTVPTETPFDVVYIDGREKFGHLIEIYPDNDAIRSLYKMTADAALNGKPDDPIVTVGL